MKGAHRAFGVSGGRSVAGDWMSSTPGWRCTPEWSLGTGGGQEPAELLVHSCRPFVLKSHLLSASRSLARSFANH